MKKPLAIVLAVAAVGAAAFFAVPAIKGPFNRAKNAATEYLTDEYVVDNYKAEAMTLVERRKTVASNIDRFTIQKRVAEKKLEYATAKVNSAKNTLLATGTDLGLIAFNRAKDTYELAKTEVANLTTLVGVYDTAIKKLEDTRALIDSNIAKCRLNVATLESKKTMAASLKSVNETIENLQGVGEDISLGISLEKLDDTILEESIKVEALGKPATVGTTEEAQAYLRSLVPPSADPQQ